MVGSRICTPENKRATRLLEARVDEVIGLFERAQLPDGYVNSHILTWRPQHRFKNLRDLHELYCAGHLIEAAGGSFRSDRKGAGSCESRSALPTTLRRVSVASQGQIRGTAGTRRSSWPFCVFITSPRNVATSTCAGTSSTSAGRSPNYFDQEAVARSGFAAVPAEPPRLALCLHAGCTNRFASRRRWSVTLSARCTLFAAAAGLALEDGDADLLATCERLWQDVVTTKLYITGGIGSASENEGFTRDYDLPNENSYAETCASDRTLLVRASNAAGQT